MAYTPVSGNDGRIKSGSTSVAGLDKWDMVKKTTGILVYHFEAALDGDSNMYPSSVLKGTSVANVSFSGHMSVDATTALDSGTPALRNGLTVTMDFILLKSTPFGFDNVPVFIEQISIGTSIGAEAAPFSGSGVVVGAPGSTGTTT